jgi:DNA-directed RNA polymerase subunit RPC12/RpoP
VDYNTGEIKSVCTQCGKKVDIKIVPFCPDCNDKIFRRPTGNSVIIGLVLDEEDIKNLES